MHCRGSGKFQHYNSLKLWHPSECFSPENFAPSCPAQDEALLEQGDSLLHRQTLGSADGGVAC